MRIGTKENGRLVYGCDGGTRYFYNSTGGYFVVEDGRWYNIQIIENITADESLAKQSIYISDKLTGELLTKAEDVALVKAVSECNLVVVGIREYYLQVYIGYIKLLLMKIPVLFKVVLLIGPIMIT